jgi:hypothetical protein
MIALLLGVAAALIGIIGGLTGDWPPLELEVWLPLGGVVIGFSCGLLGTLSLVRYGGYRLFWGREVVPTTVLASAAPNEVLATPQP